MSLHVTPAAVSSIAVQTTYHLTRGAAPSSSSALAAKGQIAGLLLPHHLPLQQRAPSPTCSLRPAQTQTHCFHTYAPFTPESHQITFEACPTLSFCCCSIHPRLPWIRIPEENLHKFTVVCVRSPFYSHSGLRDGAPSGARSYRLC